MTNENITKASARKAKVEAEKNIEKTESKVKYHEL